MRKFFADLHVHIGSAGNGSPVKITASRNLTVLKILEECLVKKGIDLVGVVDSSSPRVQKDLAALLDAGELIELAEGGLRYREKVTLILGAELETVENVHCLSYFPDFRALREFSRIISSPGRVSNINLSSQRCGLSMQQLWEIVDGLGGFLVPAHAFTPHKGLYGSCVRSAEEILTPPAWDAIPAVELGLSSDSYYADMISELAAKTFITNSDAHSLPKIAREYNIITMLDANFRELILALRRESGRSVSGNYGLDPRLGKYHRTFCDYCQRAADEQPPVALCKTCHATVGGSKMTMGVLDRIFLIRDKPFSVSPEHRPPYVHQIPLENIPGVGPKTLGKLLRSHTEMDILHKLCPAEIADLTTTEIAKIIIAAREGLLSVQAGGGGRYGRVEVIKG